MLAILLDSTETRCILFGCGWSYEGSDAENAQRYRSCPGGGLRLIRIDGSSDPERKLKWLRESGHALPVHKHVGVCGKGRSEIIHENPRTLHSDFHTFIFFFRI